MKSHTVGHQSILDPTGSLPVYPSEATMVKNWSFGMGTGAASAELIAKYQQLNPEVEPNETLLPCKLRFATAHVWFQYTAAHLKRCLLAKMLP